MPGKSGNPAGGPGWGTLKKRELLQIFRAAITPEDMVRLAARLLKSAIEDDDNVAAAIILDRACGPVAKQQQPASEGGFTIAMVRAAMEASGKILDGQPIRLPVENHSKDHLPYDDSGSTVILDGPLVDLNAGTQQTGGNGK